MRRARLVLWSALVLGLVLWAFYPTSGQTLGLGINSLTLYPPNQIGGNGYTIQAAATVPTAARTVTLNDYALSVGQPAALLQVDSTQDAGFVAIFVPSLTPAATPAAIGTTSQTFTVTGLGAADVIMIMGPAPTSLCPNVSARVSALNTLQLSFSTLTAAACTPAAGVYTIYAFR